MRKTSPLGAPRIIPQTEALPIRAPALVRHIAYWKPRDTTDIEWRRQIDKRLIQLFKHLSDRASEPNSGIKQLTANTVARVPEDEKEANEAIGEIHGQRGRDNLQCGHEYLVLFEGCYDTFLMRNLYHKDLNFISANVDKTAAEYLQPHKFRIIDFQFRWLYTQTNFRFALHHEYLMMTIVVDASRKILRGDSIVTKTDDFKRLEGALIRLAGLGGSDKALFNELYMALPDLLAARTLSTTFRELLEDTDEEGRSKGTNKERNGRLDAGLPVQVKKNQQSLQQKLVSIGRIFADFRCVVSEYKPQNVNNLASFRQPFILDDDYDARAEKLPAVDWVPIIKVVVQPFIESIKDKGPLLETDFTVSRLLNSKGVYATTLDPKPHASPQALYGFYCVVALDENQIGRLVETFNNLGTLRLAATHNAIELDEMEPKIGTKEVENYGEIDGGFENRIEQSRSYAKQWYDDVEFLRLKPIVGYQPYDEFVKRRFRFTFDRVDRLGERHEHKLNIGTQLEIAFLQRVAELLMLTVLSPYYLSHILVYSCALDEHNKTHLAKIGEVWFYVFGIFYIFAIIRIFSQQIAQSNIWDIILIRPLLRRIVRSGYRDLCLFIVIIFMAIGLYSVYHLMGCPVPPENAPKP